MTETVKKQIPIFTLAEVLKNGHGLTVDEAVAEFKRRGFTITRASLQARCSKLRQSEYHMVEKKDAEGNTIYQMEGDEFKTNKEGEKMPVLVFDLDDKGEKKLKRPALPIQKFKRQGNVALSTQMDDIQAILAGDKTAAEVMGETPKDETDGETDGEATE